MKKKIYIIHGWGGSPSEPMHQWLKTELQKKGFEVVVTGMPHPENPTIKDWVSKLAETVGQPDRDTILVGHSIGCQTILRYLEELRPSQLVGGVVFIAPWLILSNLSGEEEWKIAKPWLETKIKEADVVRHTPKIIAIFSDSDPFVSMENIELFKKRFGAKIIVGRAKGHFTADDGVIEEPQVLDAILQIASSTE